jgi:protein TonB
MKFLTPIVFCLIYFSSYCQDNESFYVFDADWKPTKMDSAHYFLHVHKLNETRWQWDFYNFMGPLVKTVQFLDHDGKIPDGTLHAYNEQGKLDSITIFVDGKRNGNSWKFYGDSLKQRIRYTYKDDSLIEVLDPNKAKKDSVVSYKDEKESEYRGGLAGWQKFLIKNIQYPDRAMNGNVEGQVIVFFIVDVSGKVIEPYISSSVEYSLDEEALRIINKSGVWVPAYQNAHNVKSYKSQPINFRLQ